LSGYKKEVNFKKIECVDVCGLVPVQENITLLKREILLFLQESSDIIFLAGKDL